MATRAYLEVGSSKVFACAIDWPGWCRSGKTEDAALEALAAYADRYAPVAAGAKVRFPKSAGDHIEVIETVKGSASTDFGVPGEACADDDRKLTKAQAERQAAFVQSAWRLLDRVAKGAPASLRKGPRGGGRDRDKMLNHVIDAEVAYARKIGLKLKPPALDDTKGVQAQRREILAVLRAARAAEPDLDIKSWPYRYAARRIAWHALDHAWEMQDRS
jgi:hypothetical protein